MRVRLDLSYDGADFHGWARQPGLRTVQETVEQAVGTVLRIDSVPQLTCAGRTDAGVHARGQVAHVDLPDDVDPAQLARRLRRLLPPDVAVRDARVAPSGFDARFSALERRYAYRIQPEPTGFDPLQRGHVVAWSKPLDVEAMNSAGELLVGEHDFAAFCKRREGATTIRTLLELHTAVPTPGGGAGPRAANSPGRAAGSAHHPAMLVTTVRADAFCHSMVRALMGALVAVGEGRYEPSWAREVLLGRERDSRVKVMPAHGLVLEEVVYPDDAELADRARTARAVRSLPSA